MNIFYSITISTPYEKYIIPVGTAGKTPDERKNSAVKKYERVADSLRRAGGEASPYVFVELPNLVLAKLSGVVRICGAGNITVKLIEDNVPRVRFCSEREEDEAEKLIKGLVKTIGDGCLTFDEFAALEASRQEEENNAFKKCFGNKRERRLYLIK